MTEQSCPMCGRANPEHLDECQHCGARLKPLLAHTPEPEEKPQEEPQEEPREQSGSDDPNEWLRSLRQEGEESLLGDEVQEPFPTWMRTGTEPPSEPTETGPESGDEWLNQMRGEDSLLGDDDLAEDSWLVAEPWEDEEAGESLELVGEDSFARLEPGADDSASDTPTQDEPEQDGDPAEPKEKGLPDWLSDISGDQEVDFIPELEDDDQVLQEESLPGWLMVEDLEDDPDEPAPDIFAEGAGPPDTTPSQDGGLVDWLEEEVDEGAQPEEPEPFDQEEGALDAGLPEWLEEGVEEGAQPEEPEPFDREEGALDAGLADWLEEGADEGAQPEEPEPLAQEEGGLDAGLADWLDEGADEGAQPEEPEPLAQEEGGLDAGLADWLDEGADEGAQPEEPEPLAQEEGGLDAGLADWLEDGVEEGAQPEESEPLAQEEGGLDAGLADWLEDGVEQGAQPEESEPLAQEEGAADDDLPSWLTGEEFQGAGPIADSATPLDSIVAWLDGLDDTGELKTDALPEEKTEFASEPEGPEPVQGATEGEAPPVEETGEELSEWFTEPDLDPDISIEPESIDQDSEPLGEIFADELSQDIERDPEADILSIGDQADLEGVPEEMSGGEPQAEEEAPADLASDDIESLPDWPSDDEEELPPAVLTPTDSFPDWLTELGGTRPEDLVIDEETGEPETQSQAFASEIQPIEQMGESSEEEEIPAWLASFAEEIEDEPTSEVEAEALETPEQTSPETGPEASVGMESITAWLSEMSGEEEPGEEIKSEDLEPAAGSGAGDQGLLDWASGFEARDEGEQLDESATDSLTDWLDNLSTQPRDEDPTESVSPFDENLPLPLGLDEPVETTKPADEPEPVRLEGGLPDWLNDLQDSVPEMDVEPELEGDGFPGFEIDSPEESSTDIEWMPEETRSQATELFETKRDEMPGDLTPGELPGWLEAMRPDEEALAVQMDTPEYEGGAVEDSGPLAGLRGLIPVIPSASRVEQPPEYSTRLQLSDLHQKHGELFNSMIQTEVEESQVPGETILSQQRILRWIIAAGLFLAVLFPLITGTRGSELPDLPAETRAVSNLIGGLDNAAPVLVIVDYEPGFSGELDAASAAVFDHLMLRGARFALVSTSPIGPAVGERLIRLVQDLAEEKTGIAHNYTPGGNYINLGYISGEAAGLHNFSISPKTTVSLAYDDRPIWELLFNQDANNAWQRGPLASINSLSDFDMTLLITDDPGTARTWIEQVGADLRPNSLVVIASAQAEPLVRPYYETSPKQVAGMVTGLSGGAAYERNIGRESLARVYWDAFGLGSLAALVLILVAGTYNLYLAWQDMNEKPETGRPS